MADLQVEQVEAETMKIIELFAFLQVLDFLTTIVGMKLGAQEFSPFIRMLMSLGPVAGLTIAKIGAFALGAICVYLRRPRVISMINYFFAGLVTWNLYNILVLVNQISL